MKKASTLAGTTRLEVIFFLGFFSISMLIIVPSLSANRLNALLASCSNNLRQVGAALRMEAADNGSGFVWSGGRIPGYQRGSPNAWENFSILSNYLASPRVFACPSDTRMPAVHFDNTANGLKTPITAQNNAVSYFIGTDLLPAVPNIILLGDRHLETTQRENCPAVLPFADIVMPLHEAEARAGNLKWKKGLHGPSTGNFAWTDGSVVQVSSRNLPDVLAATGDLNRNNHVLPPY